MVFACAVVTRHTQRNSRKLCAAFFILVIIINISKQDDHMVVMRSRNSCRTLGAPRDGRYPIDVRPRSCEAAEQSSVKIFRKQDHWKLVFCICLLFFLWSRYRNHLQLFWLLLMLIHFFWPFCNCMLLFVECIEVGA